MVNKQRLLQVFLWLWIGGASIAYLYQFKSYVDPILRLVGLK